MEQQQFIPRKRTAWQKFIYNPYLDYVTLLLLLAATLLIGYFARPKCNFLFFTDLSLSFPFQEREVVPLWLLLVLILPCTMVVIAFVMLITARSSWFRCMHRGIFVLFQALVLQQLFVEVTKVLVGRYRPDFLARVQRYMLREGISVTPTYMELCNVKDSELRQGRVSFVSGHASSMFCAMAVICYVGYVRLRVSNDGPFAIWLPLARLTLCVSPFFAAIMVAASRFWDHRHHISDILGGAVLGTAVAFAVCRIHHRRLLKGLHPTIFVPKKREQEALPPLVHPGSFIYTSYPSNIVNVPQVPTSVPTSAPTYLLPAQNPLPQNSPYPIHIPAMVGQPVVQV